MAVILGNKRHLPRIDVDDRDILHSFATYMLTLVFEDLTFHSGSMYSRRLAMTTVTTLGESITGMSVSVHFGF